MATAYSSSETLSIVSQPGMQALSTSGSLRASQTRCCGRGMSCSPVISICISMRRRGGRTRLLGERTRQRNQTVDVVRRQERIHVRQHCTHAGCARLEVLVAQERI